MQAGPTNSVASFSYTFDTLGNLTRRVDALAGLTEDFTYDVLNRLTTYQIAGQAAQTMSYDVLGNIASKPDVGTYAYPAAGTPHPHAVTGVAGPLAATYAYDANGNMVAGAGRTLSWTPFNKVAAISTGVTSLSWTYGPERQRIRQNAPAGITYNTNFH